MTEIGVVGAGGAAAAATYVLDETVPDARITVLEKSGGVCGRAATRRNGDVTYDYGANYVKSEDERVADLLTETLSTAGLVDITAPIYTFDADGTVSEGRDADEHKWTYRSGLTQVAKRLFDRTDATVHRRTRVEGISRDPGDDADESAGTWYLTDDDDQQWGPFDRLLLNPPAPQTAALLASADWNTQARADLEAAARDVEFRNTWTAVLHYPFRLERPYYALVNTDKAHEVGWVAREECKPGHMPDGESLLVVQAGHEWSVEHHDDPPEENVAELAALTADVLGDERLTDPDWTDHQSWRYAQPEGGVRTAAVDTAAQQGCHVIGDWVAGEARLHAALRNGLDTGQEIALSLP